MTQHCEKGRDMNYLSRQQIKRNGLNWACCINAANLTDAPLYTKKKVAGLSHETPFQHLSLI